MITIRSLASSSKGNAHWITDGHTPLLLDCGIGFKEIQRGTRFLTSEIAGCLLSHSHEDHCKSVREVLKAGMEVYLSEATKQALFKHQGNTTSIPGINEVKPKIQFQIRTWTILPFELEHDVENFGYLLQNPWGEKLVYITDSFYCRYRFNGLTHIMIETNYAQDILEGNVRSLAVPVAMKNRLIRSHMSLETAKAFLQANDLSKVEEIILIHLSEANSDEARFKREIQELTGKVVRVACESGDGNNSKAFLRRV